jgi:L-lactate dehydrogenase complex protein LldE
MAFLKSSTDEVHMRVAFFATCLVDAFRPTAGFAAVSLLEQAGCEVDVPMQQTCCGQPAYNNGDLTAARILAKQVIGMLSGYDYVVVPSASCAGMLKQHYPYLFEDNPPWREKAFDLSNRCYELIGFLHDILQVSAFPVCFQGSVTYHDSCSSLREVPIKQQVRKLLASNENLQFVELTDTEVCCGFGGTFCVKFPEIATSMVNDKVANIEATGAEMLVSADMGCLLHITGRLKRLNKSIRVYHIAELLAGMTDTPGIGDGADSPISATETPR